MNDDRFTSVIKIANGRLQLPLKLICVFKNVLTNHIIICSRTCCIFFLEMKTKESSFGCTKSSKKFFFSKIVFYDRRFAHLSLSPSASPRTGEKRLNYQQKSSNSFFVSKLWTKELKLFLFCQKVSNSCYGTCPATKKAIKLDATQANKDWKFYLSSPSLQNV